MNNKKAERTATLEKIKWAKYLWVTLTLTKHITLVKRNQRRERKKFANGCKKKKYDDIKKGKTPDNKTL